MNAGIGKKELWNDGIMGRKMNDKNPTFQYSIIPALQFVSSAVSAQSAKSADKQLLIYESEVRGR